MDNPITNNESPDFSHDQQQLARLKSEIQPAIHELDAGLGKELDMNSIIDRVKKALAKEGIVD